MRRSKFDCPFSLAKNIANLCLGSFARRAIWGARGRSCHDQRSGTARSRQCCGRMAERAHSCHVRQQCQVGRPPRGPSWPPPTHNRGLGLIFGSKLFGTYENFESDQQAHTVALPHYIVKFVWNPYLNLTMTWSKSDHVSNLIGFSMESLRLDITW
jgi:hypothetical protein